MGVITMCTVLSNCRVSSSYHHLLIAGILLLVFLCLPTVIIAQQPTATISSLSGQVLVSIQGKEPVTATVGTTLRTGDIIETQAGAQVVLLLSEGSELRLGQNTKIDIAALTSRPKTGARKSRIKLWYGRIRTLLSPGHQKKGSSFTVETPNARAGVKFSQPDLDVIYKPNIKTTIIRAYTVAVSVTNLVTKEVKGIPKAHQAIVQDEFIWIIPISPGGEETPPVEEIPPEEKQRQTRTGILLQSRQIAGGTVSTVPISAGARAETSQSPGPGTSPVGPRPRTIIVNTSEE
jgi:hypothetical protein